MVLLPQLGYRLFLPNFRNPGRLRCSCFPSPPDQDLTNREEQHASLSNAHDCAANPGLHRNRRAHQRCAPRAPCVDGRPGTAQSDRVFTVLRCGSNGHVIYTNTDCDLATRSCDARRNAFSRLDDARRSKAKKGLVREKGASGSTWPRPRCSRLAVVAT